MLDTVDNDLCGMEHRKHSWQAWGPGQTALSYANVETAPLRIARYSGAKSWSTLSRYHKWNMERNNGRIFRLVVGPDLVAEKNAGKNRGGKNAEDSDWHGSMTMCRAGCFMVQGNPFPCAAKLVLSWGKPHFDSGVSIPLQ